MRPPAAVAASAVAGAGSKEVVEAFMAAGSQAVFAAAAWASRARISAAASDGVEPGLAGVPQASAVLASAWQGLVTAGVDLDGAIDPVTDIAAAGAGRPQASARRQSREHITAATIPTATATAATIRTATAMVIR